MASNAPRPAVGAGARTRFTSIPNFSDQPSLPRIMKLRLGIKESKGTSKEHPKETDHFVLDIDDSVAPADAKEIKARFESLYGERPLVITGVRSLATEEETFSSDFEKWRSGKLWCHGNGVEASRKINGVWMPLDICAHNGCPDYDPREFTSRLRFMLPEVSMSGYVQIDTGSIYSSANIRNGLNLARLHAVQLFGEPRISAIPLTLLRAPQGIEFDGKLNQHFIMHLRPENQTLGSLKQLAASRPMLPAAGASIPDTEFDMPEDHIPASEQQEEDVFDPDLADFIDAAKPLLKWNAGTEEAKRAQFPRQADLHAHAVSEVDRAIKALFDALKMPDRDAKDLRAKFQDSPLSLLGDLLARWDSLPVETRRARKAGAA